MQTYYRDREGGRYVFYTYCDGLRVGVSEGFVIKEMRKGRAHLVIINH